MRDYLYEVKKLIGYGIDPDEVDEYEALDELGFDVLEVTEMIMKCEKEFDIEIPLDAKINCINDIYCEVMEAI